MNTPKTLNERLEEEIQKYLRAKPVPGLPSWARAFNAEMARGNAVRRAAEARVRPKGAGPDSYA